jgi:aminoglycoside phosphotransferase (APT) family kinase protein
MSDIQDIKTLSSRLISYLRAQLGDPALDFVAPLIRLQGGYETAIYRFELDGAPAELDKPLVLRLYPPFYGAGSATWESTLQNVLATQGYPVARTHILCTDMSVLGGAFFIMDHLPGQTLAVALQEEVSEPLGRAHAELHNLDPVPLIATLREKGINDDGYRLKSRFDWLKSKATEQPWLHQAVDWLLEHRPPEPVRLSICHGDFHPFNIMSADGEITGVLDWGGFSIADPVYDVGNTMVLITVAFRHLAASIEGLPPIHFDRMAECYLAAYRVYRPLDEANLDYYRVRRCVMSLAQGVEGQKVWQHPLIVRDLLAFIRQITGIQITMPK